MSKPVLLWLRRDLRLRDNPALVAAVDEAKARKTALWIVYILEEEGVRPLGSASRWWLHGSLRNLAAAIENLGSRLILRRGAAQNEIIRLAQETQAASIHWNRRYDGPGREVDKQLKAALRTRGMEATSHHAALLVEPWVFREGVPYKVFTPFWKLMRTTAQPARCLPTPAPDSLTFEDAPKSERLADWGLLPETPDWAEGLRENWQPGETAALQRLDDFISASEDVDNYPAQRDFPAVSGTSRLSAHLAFGEIGPRQIWHRVMAELIARPNAAPGLEAFLRELGWREFCHHLLFHFPDITHKPWKPAFQAFPWRDDTPESRALLKAWQQGRTGIPLVDAGQRELWHTGWIHNRVRMISASFLTKNLRLPWQWGEAWFWDTLVDADLANNAGGWQWVAGCGADAAPYFRIFNPLTQAEKFDPSGEYINRWLPEVNGSSYPAPIVDVKQSRQSALDAYAEMKNA